MPSQDEAVAAGNGALGVRLPLDPPLRTNENFLGTPYGARPWFELLVRSGSQPLWVHWRESESSEVFSKPMAAFRGNSEYMVATILSNESVGVVEISERDSVESNSPPSCVIQAPSRVLLKAGVKPTLEKTITDKTRLDDCMRTIRPKDKFVEILYEASPLWLRCSLVFATVGRNQEAAWAKPTRLPMQRYSPGRNGGNMFSIVLCEPLQDVGAEMVEFYFLDGRFEDIDNNTGGNYAIGCHGKYEISHEGSCLYLGPADLDSE